MEEYVKLKRISYLLKKEIQELEVLIKELRKNMRNAPKGHVRVSQKGKKREFYYTDGREGEKRNGRYMRRSELALAQKIVQRDYEMQLLSKSEKRLLLLKKFLKNYEDTSLKKVFQKVNKNRQDLIQSTCIPDEEYIKQWQSVSYEGNTSYKFTGEIITEKGEYVRSKSEKIIADKLHMLGIPYRYEYPLELNGKVMFYPDFTILKVDTREEIYLEHFGLMDNKEYVEKAIYKLDTYAKNGIFLGVNLLITYETQKSPLNVKCLDEMLRCIFSSENNGILV